MKKVRHIANILFWTFLSIYASLSILLQIPVIQKAAATYVSDLLEKRLGTETSIGNINLGILDRIIIDDIDIKDKSNKDMLHASRISVSLNLWELTKGNINISSAQIFGLKANLYKKDENTAPNFQFVIDSLSSDKKGESKLDIKINSFIIRHGAIRYDRLDMPYSAHLTPHHISATDISSHIIIKHISNDEINASIKKLTFKERSGLNVKKLAFNIFANKNEAKLNAFCIELPNSHISSDSIKASYSISNGSINLNTLRLAGNISGKTQLTDYAFLCPILKDATSCKFNISTNFSISDNNIHINPLTLKSADSDFLFLTKGTFSLSDNFNTFNINTARLKIGESTMAAVSNILNATGTKIPEQLKALKEINLSAKGKKAKGVFAAEGSISTNVGNVKAAMTLNRGIIKSYASVKQAKANELLGNDKFGTVSCDVRGSAHIIKGKLSDIKLNGNISDIDYNKYSFKDIKFDGIYNSREIKAKLNIHDPNLRAELTAFASNLNTPKQNLDISLNLHNISPQRIKLSEKWGDTNFEGALNMKSSGNKSSNFRGDIRLENFNMRSAYSSYSIKKIEARIHPEHISINSDFANIELDGKYDIATIDQSILAIIKHKLPTIPFKEGVRHFASNNKFTLSADINDTKWLNAIIGIPFVSNAPIKIDANINDNKRHINANINMPDFSYEGEHYMGGQLSLTTVNDTLAATCRVKKLLNGGKDILLNVKAGASDNELTGKIDFTYNSAVKIKGTINSETSFYKNENGDNSLITKLFPSHITVQDTVWNISPSSIEYNKNRLRINHFALSHNGQHIKINGSATSSPEDSISVALQDVDVNYILNLVNFHSVTFDGLASGTACLKSVFSNPDAYANISVSNFKFQDGRMGTLYADVNWNKKAKQIDIDAHADDKNDVRTDIKGYVSPSRNYIDLGIYAHNTNIEFMKSFCSSFMSDINASANGYAQVYGDLSCVNMRGKLVADGTLGITPLNTVYKLENDTITMIPDEILFNNDTVSDRNGNIATISGALHHKHLTRLTYDLKIKASDFLCYDFKDYGSNTFYGTVFGSGECVITGRPHRINFDIDFTPSKESFIEYNAATPDAITDRNFLTWTKHEAADSAATPSQHIDLPVRNDASDMTINFNINTTPDFTLRLLMDKATGDKISLNGSGTIKATYFNKGSFDMFGTYSIDHGTYNMTIQNIIRKDFRFQQGSSIVFGGNPFNSILNLKAIYPINGVSLADLKIGNSFSSNNVRVDCIMNIGGTPEAIKVDFDFDMPTVNNDAKQMVRSLINSEEEMNQQVVYLLAIGRFYTDNKNNARQEDAQQSQTSLAMQSLLSGTISQQVNSILGTIIKNNNWNFGTNISTGTEGFSNAEYEGMLSGSLFSNRLLINGQFGYRDNPNTTSSFIGDFDIKYLLTPSGNIAIKVYNQTNDRYFTKSSLNTQGIGIVLKKDFANWRSLFKSEKKEKKKKRNAAKR